MSEAISHTAGPWEQRAAYVVEMRKGRSVAICPNEFWPEDEACANARLLAAALVLLAALKELTPLIPDKNAFCHVGICSQEQCINCNRIKSAHDAIAKAEGRAA
jgi:hypothetical protein